MNFPEALVYLADRAGLPVPDLSHDKSDQHVQNQDKKKQMLRLNKVASDFFIEIYKRTATDHPIKQYVQKRKLKPETLEQFGIGYAPVEWDALTMYLARQKYSAALAEEARLIKARKDGSGHFDLFRDRLMFPIQSPSGEVLAFGGRIHDQGEPKYLNSPETLVFSKSKVLYGLYQTAKYIRSEDCVVVVEGYMDLVSLYQSGLKNVVATMGTALTPEHAKLIKRMTNNVIILFDGDEAGQMAAERSLTILLSQGLYPKGLILTEAKDPDEFIHKFGLTAMQEKIQRSADLFNVVLSSWMQDYRGEASQKVKLVDKIKPVFDSIIDPRLKSLYGEDLAQRMNVAKDWLRSALKQSPVAPSNANRQTAEIAESETPKTSTVREDSEYNEFLGLGEAKINLANAPLVETTLLKMVLKSRANMEWLLSFKGPEAAGATENYFKQILSQISHSGVRQILEIVEQVYRQDVQKFDKFFILLIEKIDKPELLFDSTSLDFDVEKEQKFLLDTIHKIQQNFLKAQSKQMTMDIKKGLDVEKLNQFAELHKNRLSLKNKK